MKKILLAFLFIIGLSAVSVAQGFQEHTVVDGETLSMIVNKYKVSPYELYQLNPDAEAGLAVGDVLVLLKNSQYPFDPTLIGLMNYKVRKKETLPGIAKVYGVEEATIKKYNTKLYANPIKKGDRIKIPVFDKRLASQVVNTHEEAVGESITKITTETISHVVLPKEGKYGISKKYGITIPELEAQNPVIVDGLKVGQVLTITKKTKTETVVLDGEFDYYTVKPKEGFYRLTKQLGVSKDSLIALNPQLAEGIKLGMLLKYPKSKLIKSEVASYNLVDSISSYKKQHITLMLPLRLHKIIENDSTSNIKERILRDRAANNALDFYSGALMAIDSVKQLGISTRLKVLDTEYNRRAVKANKERIATLINNSFEADEVVIGPLASSNVALVAAGLEEQNIPVLAPFPIKNAMPYKNLYETASTVIAQKNSMISFLKEYTKGKNVIIVVDKKKIALKDELFLSFPKAKIIMSREGDLIIPKDFDGKLSTEIENVVIVEAAKVSLVATATSILDTKVKKHKITMATTTSKRMFDDKAIANRYKSKLNFHFPAVIKETSFENEDKFVAQYKELYGKLPNKYALRGFDLVLDVLLRQAVAERFENSIETIGETTYLENKFNYYASSTGGFVNKAMYILKYTPEFTLEEVKLENTEKENE